MHIISSQQVLTYSDFTIRANWRDFAYSLLCLLAEMMVTQRCNGVIMHEKSGRLAGWVGLAGWVVGIDTVPCLSLIHI